MMGSVPFAPQHFMPMMPDQMQCFPPSPIVHCSMYDAQGWGMMPMYPMSPIQPLPENRMDNHHYHPRKPWNSEANFKMPIETRTERTILIQNLNTTSTTSDLTSLLRGAGIVEQCNVTITADTRDTQARTHGSAIMQSTDDAKRAVSMLNNLTFMGSRIRVTLDKRPFISRSGSWDGAMADTIIEEEEQNSTHDQSSECSECGQGINSKKSHSPNQPLVVDGSGQPARSLEYLSTSAPT